MKNIDCLVDIKETGWQEKATNNLDKLGVTILRNIINKENLKNINIDTKNILKNRSLSGLHGYIQKDPFKKMYDGFLVSPEIVKILTHIELIKLLKNYINDDVVLTECFLKHDLGSQSVYFPYHRHTGSDLLYTNNENKFGCGVIIYLHDTDKGAFCYMPSSHNFKIENKNQFLLSENDNYNNLKSQISRVNGKAGDLVIFNEAGYHGPEQPVKNSRTVIISGFQSKKMSGNKTRTEIPVLLSNLNSLSSEQLKVLGYGSSSRSSYQSYHMRKRMNSFSLNMINSTLNFVFQIQRLKQRFNIRKKLSNFLNK